MQKWGNEISREDVLDIKEVVRIIKRNWWIIVLFVLLSGIAVGVYLYFATPKYKTYGTVEVSSGNPQNAQNDLLAQALNFNLGPNAINTEMQIIKSRSLIIKALNKVNMTNRFYIIRNFKTIEILDKKSPFIVKILKGDNFSFILKPLTQNKFIIEYKYKNNEIKKEYSIGDIIKTPLFEIKILKRGRFKLDYKYKFVKINKIDMANSLTTKLNVTLLAPKASIIKVEYVDNIPSRASDFINTLLNVYIKNSIKNKTLQADQTLKFIDSQLKIVSKKLAESELALERYKKTHKIIDLGIEAQDLLKKLNDLQTKLNEIKLKENLINFIEQKIQNSNTISLVSADILDDQVLQGLISQLQQLLLKKQDLLIEYTPKYPGVIKINDQIRTLKQMIENRIKNIKSILLSNKIVIEKMIQKYSNMLGNLPQNERKLIDLQRIYQVNEKIYSYLLEKRAATALAKSSIISNNRIIDTALTPKHPFKPKKKIAIVIALILGLIIGIAVVFIKEFLDDKIKTKEDIENLTDVSIVGVVPHFKGKETLKVLKSPKSVVSEAFRGIRANIKFLSKNAKVITITSTVPSEGKTTVSSNLATIYAMLNKKTVVVNLDMRKPALHKVFEVENKRGISNVLAGEFDILDVIQPSKIKNLDIIPSGPIPPNPGDLIQSEEIDTVIRKLKEIYDIIVIDTPPVGLVVDAINILEKSDVNLYLFRANYSKKEFVKVLNDLKHNKGIKGLGIVLNDVKDKTLGYGGYGYGYGYYTKD